VGGSEVLRADARVVAATHKPVRPGQPGATLREDLYYRLARHRAGAASAARAAQRHPAAGAARALVTRARAVSEEAMTLLQRYAWPGNVRELVHTWCSARRRCAAAEVIDAPDLPAALRETSRAAGVRGGGRGGV
jgi:transcriptional regulator with PAS, ATPase and Fis domain